MRFLPSFRLPKVSGLGSVFLTRRQFDRVVTRERIRASRRAIPFCIVNITIAAERKVYPTKRAARVLLRNLRLTDEKAMLSPRAFSVLLVDTPQMGGRTVVDRLEGLFAGFGIGATMELKVHDPSAFDGVASDGIDGSSSTNPPSLEAMTSSAVATTSEGMAMTAVMPESAIATVTVTATRWSEQATWQADAVSLDRRGLPQQRLSDLPLSSADEAISSDDPLVSGATMFSLVKRCFDLAASLAGLMVCGPLLLVAMFAIRISSPGSAIFCQTREGRRGKPFTIYKLRTMHSNAELIQESLRAQSHRDGPAFKIKHDPRVTRVGRWLRATCIDELPQLVNVLRGDMSVVGPRPLPWHESRACSHWHRRRLDVRPGLTCFWQVDKASAETFDDWMRLDLDYVDRGSLWIDAQLIYRTLAVALLGRGGN